MKSFNRSFCLYLALVMAPFLTIQGQSLDDWKKIQSVDDVCLVFPGRMETLLQQINLDSPGLEAVKNAFDRKQVQTACKLLLDYYRDVTRAGYPHLECPAVSQVKDPAGGLVVQNIYTIQNVEAKVPYKADGHIDWEYRGPNDDREWAWLFNRFSHLSTLLNAYRNTGNPLYAQTMDLQIKDWVIASLPYPAKKSNTGMWRGLEVHSRAKQWARIFYALNHTNYLSPATQLLILSSLPEHAHYLRNFHAEGNWLTMEMSALATIATAWPEFKESPQWFQYSVATMTKSLEEQVYPDGAQMELTSHYHLVALNNFKSLLDICKRTNQPLPGNYGEYIEKMWSYLAYTMRPDGYGLLNNDADLNYNRELVGGAADQYGREDWKYIISNGKEGVEPVGGPSVFFPWAGHLITRSGYDPAAQWAFFDMGPWGTGHQHNDKLHLSVMAYGREFLVDAGRFSYTGKLADKFRGYACGSAGHNVILIDGKGQAPGPKQTHEPLTGEFFKITDQFDYGWNSFDRFVDVAGNCGHSRALFYVRGAFWVVVDRITTDRPRTIEALWHWHPQCTVNVTGKQTVTAQNGPAFLQIIPVGPSKWSVDMAKGQETPSVQGWYSKEYNDFEPNTASIFKTEIRKEASWVWILYPSEKQDIRVQAKIVSENKDGIVLQVKIPGKGQWKLDIPFADSAKASLKTSK